MALLNVRNEENVLNIPRLGEDETDIFDSVDFCVIICLFIWARALPATDFILSNDDNESWIDLMEVRGVDPLDPSSLS